MLEFVVASADTARTRAAPMASRVGFVIFIMDRISRPVLKGDISSRSRTGLVSCVEDYCCEDSVDGERDERALI